MAATKSLLQLAQALHHHGVEFSRDVGQRVAREYADLGAEEFILLGGNRIVSLFTGKPSEIPEGHEKHFFRIPSIDELVDALSGRGVLVRGLHFRDQRSWIVEQEGVSTSAEQGSSGHPTAEEALMALLLSVHAEAPALESKKPARLRSISVAEEV
jgi:hypothetical protein